MVLDWLTITNPQVAAASLKKEFVSEKIPDRHVPVHALPGAQLGMTGFGFNALFEELAIEPRIDVVFADCRHVGPLRQRPVSLILEKDLSVVGLLAAEATLVYEVMMVPA